MNGVPTEALAKSIDRRLLYLVFFASGLSGLLLETLWFYQAGLALGNSYWAATVVISAFMGGLAVGNGLAMLRGQAAGNSLRTYAILEVIIALAGPLLVLLLPLLGKLLAPAFGLVLDKPFLVNPLRFLAAFLVLLVPSTAMGMTLPVLTEALAEDASEYRGILGKLYGLNTLGAVAGTLAGELWLIGGIGIWKTALVAALFNLAAAGAAWRLARHFETRTAAAPRLPWRALVPDQVAMFGIAVGLSGFLLLALEVVWFRFLSLFVRISSLSFAVMLAVVLAGIALGGLAASALPRRWPGLLRSVSLVPFLAGVLCVLGYALFPVFHRPLAGTMIAKAVPLLWIAIPLMFPVSFLSGAFFTLAGDRIRKLYSSSQVASGALTLFNTLGASFGAVLAGFVLIPVFGMEGSFFILALVYGLTGLAWWVKSGEGKGRLALGAAIWAGALAFFPFGIMYQRHFPMAASRWSEDAHPRLVDFREGLAETLLYLEFHAFGQPISQRMLTNSFSMSANNIGSRRYMKQYVYWPLAVHPQATDALLICFGVGSTAKALTDSRGLESIHVVDISRDVLDMSRIIFPDPKDHPLRDPRVSVHVEDGRCFLQGTSKKFDIITGEPPPPVVPGVSCLYTQEYFQLIHDHLNEGGIVTYWLPISQMGERASLGILKAFSNVFGQSYLWHGTDFDLMIVGVRGSLPPANPDRFAAQWKDPRVAPEMARLGFENPAQIGAGFIGDRDFIRHITRDIPPLVDDHPKRILATFRSTGVYESFFDTDAARRRFIASRDIHALLPAPWIDRSLPCFDFQQMVTTLGKSVRQGGFPDLSEVHRLALLTPFRTPVLWALGSDDDVQRAWDRAPEDIKRTTTGAFHGGIRALAERNYPLAFDRFRQAAAEPVLRKRAVACALYAGCMAKRQPEASEFLASLETTAEVRAIPREYWGWMDKTFGFQPQASTGRLRQSSGVNRP